ncbi:hypothetical protein GCM10020001_051840 [Nonomuraea salmonea]
MNRVWNAGPVVRPFLSLGRRRNILATDTGTNLPFTIENYPYADSYGRETVTFVRAFPSSRFDATMIYDPAQGEIVDYLGTHQHLAVPPWRSPWTTGAAWSSARAASACSARWRCRCPPPPPAPPSSPSTTTTRPSGSGSR